MSLLQSLREFHQKKYLVLHEYFYIFPFVHFYFYFLRFGATVFFQNIHDLSCFKKNPFGTNNSVQIIPGSGVDINEFAYLKPKRKNVTKFAYIGRLLLEKGIIEFLDTAAHFKQKNLNTEFHVFGNIMNDKRYVNFEELQNSIKRGHIIYHGFIPDIKSEIEKVDCIILPSYSEGAPKVILEAGSIGRASIVTNIAGNTQIIENGKNGFICEVGDVKSLITRVNQYLKLDKNSRLDMSIKARENIVENFKDSIIVDRYIDIIEKCLNEIK